MLFPVRGKPNLKNVEIRGLRTGTAPIAILHLSDLHGRLPDYSDSFRRILQSLAPDLIALTGDILDEHTKSLDQVSLFLQALPPAPTFFVRGNHDSACPVYGDLLELFESRGIRVLENGSQFYLRDGTGIPRARILGIDDPLRGDFDLLSWSTGKAASTGGKLLEDPARSDFARSTSAKGTPGPPTILLAHSPTLGRRNALRAAGEKYLIKLAARKNIDLVLCGHTHGGQIRLPLIGALFVPGQGLFPRYVHGVYSSGPTRMYITSGLGTTHLPVRFLCPPEVAFIRWYP